MRVYIENIPDNGNASSINFFVAKQGFLFMGFHVIEVNEISEVPINDIESVVVGSINFIHGVLNKMGKPYPKELDYPECLQPYLGRKIWASTINEIDANPEQWNVFVKPRGIAKKFVGRLVKHTGDLMDTGDQFLNTPVWVSEPVEFIREWRVFVRYGKVLDVRPYKGDWKATYDAAVIEKTIADFTNAPNAYAMDFGVTKDGRTLLVEVNDGYSVGAYGLFFTDYSKLLSARWAELTGQRDLCDFDL